MKSWRYLTIVGMLFLTACTAKPNQVSSASFDNCSTSPQGFICPNLPMPSNPEDWEKCKSYLAKEIRSIYEHFPADLDAALANRLDGRVRDQLNSELFQCLIALEDSMSPAQDSYYSSLMLIKHIKRYKIEDNFSKLLALLEEMNKKAEPLIADPKDIDDFLGFYGEYLKRSLGNLAVKVSDMKAPPSQVTLDFDKAALSCAILASSQGADEKVLSSALQAMELLKKLKAEGKYPDFLIRSFGTALSKIICKLAPSTNPNNFIDISFAIYEDSPQGDADADGSSKQSGQNKPAPASKSGQNDQKKGASTANEESPAAAQQPSEPKAMSLTPNVGQEITTPSGLRIKILAAGSGPACKINDTVSVHYTGKLHDGTVFDSSYERHHPLTFPLGQGYVIDGWEAGIPGMKVGEKRHIVIPPALGYGDTGSGPIPPNSTLEFDIELVTIK